MNLKRRGVFIFTKEFVLTGVAGKILAFMEFTPVSASFVNFGEAIEYEGYSKMFDETENHTITPRYTISADANSDNEVTGISVDRI